ncbi:MAG: DUF7482 domain-containing protein, partial [Actinomycetota bacterium]
MRSLKLIAGLAVLALVAAACGSEEPAVDRPAAETPEPTAQMPPLIGGFYEGDDVTYLLTDVSVEAEAEGLSEATGFPVSFVPSLGDIPKASLAKLYLFMNGVEGPNPFGFQPNVLDTVPGDPGYSPLWLVHAVTWADGAEPRELRSEGEILEAEDAGELAIEVTPLVKNSPVVATNPPLVPGFAHGEGVNYLLTDVSVEAEAEGLSDATGFPVSFVPSLGDVPESSLARLYLFMNGVEGPNPFGFQPNVLDTVPGDPGYSPLWLVHAVT